LNLCVVCGSNQYTQYDILNEQLISEWNLSAREAEIINLEQGLICDKCGVNPRAQALAAAILIFCKFDVLFINFIKARQSHKVQLLEINTAGFLSPFLQSLRNHTLIEYPEIDIQNLQSFRSGWDLVITSDTLEHVPDPTLALSEIYRILRPGGAKIFTTPFVLSRLSKSRRGEVDSYHGDPMIKSPDYLVHWEFGADLWKFPYAAGFSRVEILSLCFPNGVALTAFK